MPPPKLCFLPALPTSHSSCKSGAKESLCSNRPARKAVVSRLKMSNVVDVPSSASTLPPKNKVPNQATRDVDLCVCHATADFDTLAAAVGLAKLRGNGTRVVIPAGEHEAVQRYLALHRGLFPLIDLKAVDPRRLRWVGVVDTHSRKRLGPAAAFVDAAEHVEIIDHHFSAHDDCDIIGQLSCENVGAVSTIIVERLMAREHDLVVTPAEATLLAIAIHTDTGNLTYENTTPRDAAALSWCLSRGACQRSIAQFARQYLTPNQQRLLSLALDAMEIETVDGVTVASVIMESDAFVKGMAGVTQAAMELSNVDVLVLAMMCPASRKVRRAAEKSRKAGEIDQTAGPLSEDDVNMGKQVSLIGRARSRVEGINFSSAFSPLGGGGHAKAGSASVKVQDAVEVEQIMRDIVEIVKEQLPDPLLVKDFMSRNVASVSLSDTMSTARDALFSLGHTGLAVVVDSDDNEQQLAGVVSRQDIALAERRGLLDTPVKGWIARSPICASEDTPLHEAEAMLADNKIGRLPVVRDGKVIGIVTRSDILVQRRLLSG